MERHPLSNTSLAELDKRSLLHPFTALADHAKNGPRAIMASGKGVRVTDTDGRQYLDGAAGLWCVNVGYGQQEIVDAIAEQSSKLSFFHSFTGMANEPAIVLADRILQLTPKGMSKVFFGNSGSDANDTNIKMIWYYNNLLGRPQKKKIIARDRAYHGVTIGAGSLTGLTYCHDAFDLPISQVVRAKSVDAYRGKPDDMSDEEFATYLAEDLEALIVREGPDTVAAFIAEPVMGTGGVLLPPKGYFEKVQAVLDKYDVLMVADEVICGFGRLGCAFGSDLYGIRPDFMTLAKGLSSGYQPISASVISSRVWEVLEEQGKQLPSFAHGFTYSAHPVAAAASLANLAIVEREDLAGNAGRMGQRLRTAIADQLQDCQIVGDIRSQGLMLGIELVADRATKQAFDGNLKVPQRIVTEGLKNGVIVRPLSNNIAMSPPLIISEEDVMQLASTVSKAVHKIAHELRTEGVIK
ncbi:aminotransferase class III-fold pyridoxal phosphate-dependent enzyme [Agrobacterium tumefaciens]|uniref:aminotransferase n=1 Tax=Agrobacterium tumefaciens TaxID=358 RepID=UPI001573167D|nr:aminotransferase [Agrobacterium tumefaciens]NTE68278.1 aminotransferase class III-fold pyridoxal phosphate-dependent enzyme [Agrobacterium tumefaciens]